MKKHFLLLIGVCFLSLIFGCSHNAITYSDGIGFETTANPQTFTFRNQLSLWKDFHSSFEREFICKYDW